MMPAGTGVLVSGGQDAADRPTGQPPASAVPPGGPLSAGALRDVIDDKRYKQRPAKRISNPFQGISSA